jgi:hypothetical protein
MRRTLLAALAALAVILVSCETATVLPDGRVVLFLGGGTAIFDPASGSAVLGTQKGTPRMGHTATLLKDGRVLYAGGAIQGSSSDTTTILDSADLYDPATATFTATGAMTAPRGMAAAARLPDGRVLVAGGCTACQTGKYEFNATADIYDPATGAFTAGPSETGRMLPSATTLQDGRVLLVGGLSGTEALTTVELFDPAAWTLTALASTTDPRALHAATLLADGRVLITGGMKPVTGGNGVPLATAEVFDPASGTFAPTGTMTTARAAHTATLLDDGRVLIAGGLDANSQALASAEVYDPKTGTFTATGSLTVPVAGHTASLLKDGRVLIWGFDMNSITASASPNPNASRFGILEAYDPATGTFSSLKI